jgi:hypothetical protein
MSLVANLEALLVALQASDVERLPPASRRRLSDALYAAHVLVEMQVTGEAFPRVKRAGEAKAGVVAQLNQGDRSQ